MSYELKWCIPIECVTKEELLQKASTGSHFVLVDTIGTYDGNRYRIKGATTIPYPEVIDRRRELMGRGEIIVYCKHKRCVASKKIASALMMLNFQNVKVYEGGIDEWLEGNLPVEEI